MAVGDADELQGVANVEVDELEMDASRVAFEPLAELVVNAPAKPSNESSPGRSWRDELELGRACVEFIAERREHPLRHLVVRRVFEALKPTVRAKEPIHGDLRASLGHEHECRRDVLVEDLLAGAGRGKA
jgi:hypothetical protein